MTVNHNANNNLNIYRIAPRHWRSDNIHLSHFHFFFPVDVKRFILWSKKRSLVVVIYWNKERKLNKDLENPEPKLAREQNFQHFHFLSPSLFLSSHISFPLSPLSSSLNTLSHFLSSLILIHSLSISLYLLSNSYSLSLSNSLLVFFVTSNLWEREGV